MPLIPESIVDEVQTRADIAELIGRYVPLKRAGRHFKALCPFHHEKSPSFMVNTEKQIYHCFGCGAGGNIFSFLMQHDRMTFPEAVRQLAEHVGVDVPDRAADPRDGTHERLAALMEKICRYFERTLQHPQQGKAARAYLESRGVLDHTAHTFRLGLALAGWEHLIKAATSTGVAPEDLESIGLVIKGRSGHYDRFRHRLIFPIMDARGRIVGFGGRSLDDQEPKYLNSPETPLYTKGRHLFGLSQAKDAIITRKTAIVVEGYFDCVVLAGGGVPHVVSPLGTAMTVEQARLLKRYAERVILAFDADAAGEAATLRGIDLLVEAGFEVHVAQLPDGVDPDECLRLRGQQQFTELLERSISIFEFLIEIVSKRYPSARTQGRNGGPRDPEASVTAAQLILPTIAKVPNAMLRREYVRLLAERLHLDEEAVTQELAKAQPRATTWSGPNVTGRAAGSRAANGTATRRVIAQGPERLLTALILDDPARWRQAQDLSLEAITDPTLRHLLGVVRALVTGDYSPTSAQVVSRLSEVGEEALVTELIASTQTLASQEDAFQDCLRRVRTSAHKRELAQLRRQLETAQEAGHETDVQRLLVEYQRQVKGG